MILQSMVLNSKAEKHAEWMISLKSGKTGEWLTYPMGQHPVE